MSGVHKIKYTVVSGMHFFTSTGGLTKGLCAGSSDLKTAFDEVAVQIIYLLKKNHGIEDADCTPAIPFEDFQAFVDKTMDLESDRIQPVPSAVIDYFNKRAAA